MKKVMSLVSVATLLLVCLLGLSACGRNAAEDLGLWADAVYTENAELGEGARTVTVLVKADDRQVTFTIHTDKTMVGDALMEHNLLEGEQQTAGLYLKKVNGITADWEVDQTYWAFYVNGEYAMTGVDATTIEEGVTYSLERTK